MSRETLIRDISENGKLDDVSWLQYASIHEIKPGFTDEQRAKAANDVWRSYQKRVNNIGNTGTLFNQVVGTISPESTFTTTSNVGTKIQGECIITGNAGTYTYIAPGSVIGGTEEQVKKASQKYEMTWNETKDTATLNVISPDECKNPDELIASCGIDTKKWDIDSFWQSNKSNKWNISCSFKKRKLDQDLGLQKDLILETLKTASQSVPKYGKVVNGKAAKDRNHLLEISLFDLHIGKLAWDEEVGEDYDSDIACQRFTAAIDDILYRADLSLVDRILFPIGNDMINVDNNAHTTTAGTPQYCDSRFAKMIKVAKNLMITTINKLSAIAPVDVLVVPGNHDNMTMFTLGEILEAYFYNNANVQVLNSAKSRKYYQYGKCGIMFCHGNGEKHADLGLIFATEEPELWANTKYREAHLGHLHKVKSTKYVNINEETGFKVRILPSLSGTDKWHYDKGYMSNKSAEAYLWHEEKGLQATFIHNA